METDRFLRDLDDEKAFAQGLELAYLEAFNNITHVGNRMWEDLGTTVPADDTSQDSARLKELRHVIYTMGQVLRDCIDRRKRLAHVAAGLPDVVFDEESP